MKMSAFLAVAIFSIGTAVGFSHAADTGGRDGAGRAGARAGRGAAAGARNGAGRAGRGDAATRGAMVDKREANQEKRIEQGIKKGQITDDEETKLKGLETNITTLEGNFKADGKLSKDEVSQLKKALNEASLQIWSERHDTEGNQKPVVRLGKDVFATDALTTKLESPNLTKDDAKSFLTDFKKLVNIKRRLGKENLPPDQRTELQTEYNNLLNKYFVQK